MDADGSIVYRWNHTFRIQMETDKVEPPVYADRRIPYTVFLCVCVYAHTYANTVEMAERRYHIDLLMQQAYQYCLRVATSPLLMLLVQFLERESPSTCRDLQRMPPGSID